MHDEEIQRYFGSPAGYLGPVNLLSAAAAAKNARPEVLADLALKDRRNLIAGANQENYHLKNLTPGRDFQVDQWFDLRNVSENESCPNCGSPLKVARAVEIGHIFKLGYKYAESMGARVLDKNGKEVTLIMGSYGIGLERILTAAIEQGHDDNGFFLPAQIAPFDVVVTATNVKDAAIMKAADEVARLLEVAGYDVLLDDRDERPGVKFKDADLVGIPFRITVGKKVTEGTIEIVERSTGKSHDATIAETATELGRLYRPGA
jgi:prolyl-tRNA synthetase